MRPVLKCGAPQLAGSRTASHHVYIEVGRLDTRRTFAGGLKCMLRRLVLVTSNGLETQTTKSVGNQPPGGFHF